MHALCRARTKSRSALDWVSIHDNVVIHHEVRHSRARPRQAHAPGRHVALTSMPIRPLLQIPVLRRWFPSDARFSITFSARLPTQDSQKPAWSSALSMTSFVITTRESRSRNAYGQLRDPERTEGHRRRRSRRRSIRRLRRVSRHQQRQLLSARVLDDIQQLSVSLAPCSLKPER